MHLGPRYALTVGMPMALCDKDRDLTSIFTFFKRRFPMPCLSCLHLNFN